MGIQQSLFSDMEQTAYPSEKCEPTVSQPSIFREYTVNDTGAAPSIDPVLQEIAHLVTIRQFVYNAVGSFSINKPTIKDLSAMQSLIDKKIISLVLGQEFKDYVRFDLAMEAKAEAKKLNTEIYSAITGAPKR